MSRYLTSNPFMPKCPKCNKKMTDVLVLWDVAEKGNLVEDTDEIVVESCDNRDWGSWRVLCPNCDKDISEFVNEERSTFES